MDNYPLSFFAVLLRKSNMLALGWEHFTALKYKFLSNFQKALIITNSTGQLIFLSSKLSLPRAKSRVEAI